MMFRMGYFIDEWKYEKNVLLCYCYNTDLEMNVILKKKFPITLFYINNYEYINSFVSKERIFASRVDEFE